MISPVEVFVFDLGGVIANHDMDFWYRRLASRCDCDNDDSRLRSALHDTRYSTGQASIAELHKHLVTTLNYHGPWEEFLLDWSCHFDIDQEMIKLLAWIARDRRVIIFSNTNREHWEYLVHASGDALANYEAFLSYQLGQAKPSLNSFRTVAARARIAPERSLFVDDRPENIAAAKEVGFQAALFTSRNALEQILRDSGVLS